MSEQNTINLPHSFGDSYFCDGRRRDGADIYSLWDGGDSGSMIITKDVSINAEGWKILDVKIEPDDTIKDVAAYSHFTVEEVIVLLERALKDTTGIRYEVTVQHE